MVASKRHIEKLKGKGSKKKSEKKNKINTKMSKMEQLERDVREFQAFVFPGRDKKTNMINEITCDFSYENAPFESIHFSSNTAGTFFIDKIIFKPTERKRRVSDEKTKLDTIRETIYGERAREVERRMFTEEDKLKEMFIIKQILETANISINKKFTPKDLKRIKEVSEAFYKGIRKQVEAKEGVYYERYLNELRNILIKFPVFSTLYTKNSLKRELDVYFSPNKRIKSQKNKVDHISPFEIEITPSPTTGVKTIRVKKELGEIVFSYKLLPNHKERKNEKAYVKRIIEREIDEKRLRQMPSSVSKKDITIERISDHQGNKIYNAALITLPEGNNSFIKKFKVTIKGEQIDISEPSATNKSPHTVSKKYISSFLNSVPEVKKMIKEFLEEERDRKLSEIKAPKNLAKDNKTTKTIKKAKKKPKETKKWL